MANYLLFDLPNPPANPNQGARGDKNDLIQVDSIHTTHIYNQSGSLYFQGYVPTDFQISLQSQWGPLFPSMSIAELGFGGAGTTAERIFGSVGASSKTRSLSAQLWEGPAYLEISLPIQINAYADTKREIIDKLVSISSFVVPGLDASTGGLIPPGPVPALQAISDLANRAGVAGEVGAAVNEQINAATNNITEEQTIICQVGRFFRMTPCIVTNVVAAFNGQPEDETSNPMAVDFNLELRSYFAVTKEDIAVWFKGNFAKPGAPQ